MTDRQDPPPPSGRGASPAGGPEAGHAAQAAEASQQLVEVVDSDGVVIKVVSRAEMRAGNLRHRCVFVAVLAGTPPAELPDALPPTAGVLHRLDPTAALVVHQRAPWKDTAPLYWDIGIGGVCDVGEDWYSAAERELAEEAGITGVPLTDLGPVRYEDDQTVVVGRAFVAWWSGELSCPDGEVVAVDRVPLSDLPSWLADRDVCADSMAAFVALLGP